MAYRMKNDLQDVTDNIILLALLVDNLSLFENINNAFTKAEIELKVNLKIMDDANNWIGLQSLT